MLGAHVVMGTWQAEQAQSSGQQWCWCEQCLFYGCVQQRGVCACVRADSGAARKHPWGHGPNRVPLWTLGLSQRHCSFCTWRKCNFTNHYFCFFNSAFSICTVAEQVERWEGRAVPGTPVPAALQLRLFLCFLLEKRQDNARVYYVNHNTRTTQWEDPRTQG